jgi:DUF4097 and DUF4098 domain-containing protein YvlB
MLTVALFTLAALAQGPDFSWSGELASGKRLTVRNISGDIRIEPASGRTVSVTGVKKAGRHGNPKDVEIRQVQTGDGVTVCVIYPGSRNDEEGCDGRGGHRGDGWDNNDTSVDFTVHLPSGTALNAMTVSGDVEGHGIRGAIEARTVSGDVQLSDVTGPVVEAQTVSGDVTLESVGADEVTGHTVSGDVEFSGEIRPKGDYDFKSLSGDVVMRIPRDAGAEVTGSTFSGDFRTSFALTTRATSRYTGSQRLNGTIGNGSARIRVESFSGSVEIRELDGRN